MIDWKPDIITLTESELARAKKIDASFFPALEESDVSAWEKRNEVTVPSEIRSFLTQSDGLEAQRGEIWPVLPLSQWEVLHDECASPDPWIRFGETESYLYFLSLGHSPSIYRHARFSSDEEFFAATFSTYLKQIFRGDG